jgi:hypothetical protein
MKPEEFKSLGLKDMHPMQVKALMDLIGMTINLATSTEDMEIIEDVEAYCDELVKLFGGNGVKLTIEVDPGTEYDGPKSVH